MEIQGIFKAEKTRSFGSPAEAAGALQRLFPDVSFSWSPTGSDLLAQIQAQGLNPPEDFLRMVAARPSFLCGNGDSSGVQLSFNVGSEGESTCIWATFAGDEPAVNDAISRIEQVLGARWVVPEPLEVRDVGDTSDGAGGATLYRRLGH